MSYSNSDIESDPETTIIAPRFNDEASRSAAPVVPLTNHTTQSINPIGQNKRQSWSIAAIFLATLIGGAAGGFALDLYLRNQKAQQINQAASVGSSGDEKAKPLMVAAPPPESVEAEIPVATENTAAVNNDDARDDAMDDVGDEDAEDEPEPVKQVVHAPSTISRNNTQSEENQGTPPTQHRPVLKPQASSTTEENQNKEEQTNDNAPKIENRQENESQPAPAPEADAGQINRVREIFEGRPRRVAAPTHTQRGGIDRVREIFEGQSRN